MSKSLPEFLDTGLTFVCILSVNQQQLNVLEAFRAAENNCH